MHDTEVGVEGVHMVQGLFGGSAGIRCSSDGGHGAVVGGTHGGVHGLHWCGL